MRIDRRNRKKSLPKKQAAVLRYNNSVEAAPVVVAKGQGEVAQTIIQKAKEHGIPIQEDALLAESLLTLDVGTQIPPQLYQVVAEVLVMVNKAND
jgi:flagellar biosynthesis protein